MNNISRNTEIDIKIFIALQHLYFFNNRPIRKIMNDSFDFLRKCSWDEFSDYAYTLKYYKYDRSARKYNWDDQFKSEHVKKSLSFSFKSNDFLEQNSQIKILTYLDQKYPHSKLNILDDDAPVILYCVGNIESLNRDAIAIIGTREPDDIYKEPGIEIASFLAKNGYSIVSGLAVGCDTLGHVGALKSSGLTTAVLANGLETIYPKENAHLAKRIVDNDGCLVTEYPPYTKIERWYFPERDRLQAALSDFLFVIATGEKGGTMITVEHAIKQNKPIFTFNPVSDTTKSLGNKKLIKQGKATGIDIGNINKIEHLLKVKIKSKATNYKRKIINHISNTTLTKEGLLTFLKSKYPDERVTQLTMFDLEEQDKLYLKIKPIIKEVISTSNFDSLDKLLDELERKLDEQRDQEIVDEISDTINKWLTQKNRIKK